MINIKEELLNLHDKKYKEFQIKLLPGITNYIGVRVPHVRKLSNKLNEEERIKYLNDYKCEYLEEYLLKGFLISKIKNINEVIKYTDEFVKDIDNWEVCDSFCSSLKIIKNNKEIFFNYINKFLYSKKEYEIRFMLVIYLNYYVCDEYIDNIFENINKIKCNYYYDKMSMAWLISVMYLKYRDKTIKLLLSKNIDKDIYKMAIRKILDSNKLDKKEKIEIKNIFL